MDISELEYSIRKSLRIEFDNSDAYRQVEIYHTIKELGRTYSFEEDIEEMRSDILSDHNIELK
tara:strand:+ start:417 stop:605 length:189 start_codon:yes stop_codon:yes gene_type:complete